MVDRFERFSLAISKIYRSWHKLAGEEMTQYGLKGAHCIYLTTIASHPEGMTAPQICQACGKDKSDVSRMMAILEKKGLVTKEGGFQNGYGGAFCLTEAGKSAAGYVRRRASLAVELAGQEISDQTRESFYENLENIAENLQRLSQAGLPASK